MRCQVYELIFSSMSILRRLCPACRPHARPTARAAYLRSYSDGPTIRRVQNLLPEEPEKWQHKELYPRITKQDGAIDYLTLKERYRSLGRGESKPDDELVVRGTSAYSLQVMLAHAVKEGYGRSGLRAHGWHSSTCSRTVGVCSWTPIDYNACLTTTTSNVSCRPHALRAF